MAYHTEQSHLQKNTYFRKSPHRITPLLPTPHIAENRSLRHVTYYHLNCWPTSQHAIHAKDAVARRPAADGVPVVKSEH